MGLLGEFDDEVVGSVGCGLAALYITGVLTGHHLLFLGISRGKSSLPRTKAPTATASRM